MRIQRGLSSGIDRYAYMKTIRIVEPVDRTAPSSSLGRDRDRNKNGDTVHISNLKHSERLNEAIEGFLYKDIRNR